MLNIIKAAAIKIPTLEITHMQMKRGKDTVLRTLLMIVLS